MVAIPSTRAPTREDWCNLVEQEWDDLVLELAELLLFHTRHAETLRAMVLARIRSGEKFGPLDLSTIDFTIMTAEEIADAVAYLGGERLHERTTASR
jgi:hypothetical protein